MLRAPKRFLLRLLKDAGFALAGVLITLTAWALLSLQSSRVAHIEENIIYALLLLYVAIVLIVEFVKYLRRAWDQS